MPRVIYNFLTIRLRTQMLIKVICTNQKENNANKGVVQRLHYSNGALMLGLWHVTNPAIWAFCCPLVLQGLEPCRIVLQFTNFLGMLKVPCSIRAPKATFVEVYCMEAVFRGLGCAPKKQQSAAGATESLGRSATPLGDGDVWQTWKMKEERDVDQPMSQFEHSVCQLKVKPMWTPLADREDQG